MEGFSHLWLLWEFSENRRAEWSPTVRPPRLGGNTRMGVFATRSPFRPNPIGLSCVKLLEVRQDEQSGMVLRVAGADLMDGTPILDIKPYLPYTDCRPDATGGFAEPLREYALQVLLPKPWQGVLPPETEQQLLAVLAQDPRPSYQEDAERVYGMSFAGCTVRFTVSGEQLTVCEIIKE
jgi:tRNA-Thr(GGU) m(6)t(6)A37 methyltransferase TsaA